MDVNLIQKINATQWQIFCAIAGGGQTFIGEYLRQSGGSKVIVGAIVPYKQSCFDKFVKVKVDNYCSEEAARKLAVASYNESISLGSLKENAVGLGVTSSLAKDGERDGREHRVNISVHTSKFTSSLKIFMRQGRTRSQEEDIAADCILEFLAAELGLCEQGYRKHFSCDEQVIHAAVGQPKHVELINGERNIIEENVDIRSLEKLIIYSGSWNPYHDGHQQVIDFAKVILGDTPILELTVSNADKGQLDFIDISVRSFKLDKKPHILTKAATFVEKVQLFNRLSIQKPIIFVMGADTWERLWKPAYGYSPRDVADIMIRNKVRFLVFPRQGYPISNEYDYLRIRDERVNNFNNTISSTSLRK